MTGDRDAMALARSAMGVLRVRTHSRKFLACSVYCSSLDPLLSSMAVVRWIALRGWRAFGPPIGWPSFTPGIMFTGGTSASGVTVKPLRGDAERALRAVELDAVAGARAKRRLTHPERTAPGAAVEERVLRVGRLAVVAAGEPPADAT